MTITTLPTPPTSSDPTTFAARSDALLGALPAFVTEANQLLLDAQTAAAAAAAPVSGASSSSLVIGYGSRSFTTAASAGWSVGTWVMAASNGSPTQQMVGQVTSYVGTTLTVTMWAFSGTGTFADWLLTQTAPLPRTGVGSSIQLAQMAGGF